MESKHENKKIKEIDILENIDNIKGKNQQLGEYLEGYYNHNKVKLNEENGYKLMIFNAWLSEFNNLPDCNKFERKKMQDGSIFMNIDDKNEFFFPNLKAKPFEAVFSIGDISKNIFMDEKFQIQTSNVRIRVTALDKDIAIGLCKSISQQDKIEQGDTFVSDCGEFIVKYVTGYQKYSKKKGILDIL